MPRIAHCSGCARYVQLTPQGECPEGHPRSMLRDVREGTLAAAPTVGVATSAPSAEEATFREYDSVFAKVVGKAVVILPIAAVLAFGLWTGVEQFQGSYMSFGAKLGWSVLSLTMTVGAAFLWFGLRKRH
ncbi:MAG TPA: hypothetical protein VIL41_02280 [Coriobacteriia bacterium]